MKLDEIQSGVEPNVNILSLFFLLGMSSLLDIKENKRHPFRSSHLKLSHHVQWTQQAAIQKCEENLAKIKIMYLFYLALIDQGREKISSGLKKISQIWDQNKPCITIAIGPVKPKILGLNCYYFLYISLNMCFGCSQQPSHRDGSFEYIHT